jgi:regulator of chromosome condensation
MLERGKPRILLQPTTVPISGCTFAAVGSEHNLVVTAAGKVYSWGFNATRQCGQSTEADIWVAKLMEGKSVREQKIIWAGAGGQYSMVASAFDGGKTKLINGIK